ncbi:unnamed protein product [Cyprideis torosa]|uniref:Uncharacterized protein n=1 Tax=Cyprideis torosa TaxID=163714 RepID=A0A7R8WA13_9CRUS|nr:unnamed protein product [Cyprideis torosa]CAG0884981.1 unnamed protein product [Cyprideis torosa]
MATVIRVLCCALSLVLISLLQFNAAQKATEDLDDFSWKIQSTILNDYNSNVSPLTQKRPLVAALGFELLRLDIDEGSHTVWATASLQLVYSDNRLRWKPQAFGEIESITIPGEKIWKPDIVLYNESPKGFRPAAIFNELTHTQALIRSTGDVVFVPPLKLGALCTLDYKYWPSDVQNCSFRFGSWSMNGETLNFGLLDPLMAASCPAVQAVQIRAELDDVSVDWFLVNQSASRHTNFYPCCPGQPFHELHFEFILLRRTGVLMVTLLLPIHVIVVLTLTSVIMTPKSNIKMGLLFFNMALLLVLMFSHSELLRTSRNIPKIYMFMAVYLIVQIVLLLADAAHITREAAREIHRKTRHSIRTFVRRVSSRRPRRPNAAQIRAVELGPTGSHSEVDSASPVRSPVEKLRQFDIQSCRMKFIIFSSVLSITLILYLSCWPGAGSALNYLQEKQRTDIDVDKVLEEITEQEEY